MGAICKAAFEYRDNQPVEPESGLPFAQANYTLIAQACLALFYSFCNQANNDPAVPNVTAQNPVLYNCAAGGCLAGALAQRMPTLDQVFDPIEPSDFNTLVTAAFVFATAVNEALTAASGVPTNVTSLTTTFESAPVTVVPSSAAVANASQSLPGAMVYICKAAWDKRSFPPLDQSGAAATVADYAVIANACVAEFLEYAASTTNT